MEGLRWGRHLEKYPKDNIESCCQLNCAAKQTLFGCYSALIPILHVQTYAVFDIRPTATSPTKFGLDALVIFIFQAQLLNMITRQPAGKSQWQPHCTSGSIHVGESLPHSPRSAVYTLLPTLRHYKTDSYGASNQNLCNWYPSATAVPDTVSSSRCCTIRDKSIILRA